MERGAGGALRARSASRPHELSDLRGSEIENEFVFVEEWESQEALQRHFGTPHIAEFMAAVPGAVVAAPDVKFHTIASTVDLADLNPG